MRNRLSFKNFIYFLVYSMLLVLVVLLILRPVISWNSFFTLDGNTKIPMVLSLGISIVLFAIIFSFLYYFSIQQSERLTLQKIEWLILGNYQHPLFFQEVWYENFLPFNLRRINASLQRLRVKLMDLSNEVQHLSSVPQYIGQETKEEILENERHRIARELHDSVSQQLFAAMMMLSAINEQKESIPEKLQTQLALVERIINESQSEMRALLLHLRPVSLENKSLKKGIEMLLKELMTKVQLEIHWELDDIHTKLGIEDHLFRIMQELLSNTLRHAKAKNLDVFLRQTPEWISLRVVDDGIGFDTNESRPGSYGLVNIRERVTGMGGTLKLLSFPNKGTIVEIKIPQIAE